MINKKATHALTFPARVMTKSKRSQEEMVGFVLIIIIVAVIGLFFMFMMSKQQKPYVKSNEVESFLYSSLLYTTSCYPEQSANPHNLQYLAEACSNNRKCSDGEDSCFVLNKTLSQILDASFNIHPEAKYKAYVFELSGYGEPLIQLRKGNLTANMYGAEVSPSSSINMTLRLYF